MLLFHVAVQAQLDLFHTDGFNVFCLFGIHEPAVGVRDHIVLVGIDGLDRLLESWVSHHQGLATRENEARQTEFIGLQGEFANVVQVELMALFRLAHDLYQVAVHVMLRTAVLAVEIAEHACAKAYHRSGQPALLPILVHRQLGGNIGLSAARSLRLAASASVNSRGSMSCRAITSIVELIGLLLAT